MRILMRVCRNGTSWKATSWVILLLLLPLLRLTGMVLKKWQQQQHLRLWPLAMTPVRHHHGPSYIICHILAAFSCSYHGTGSGFCFVFCVWWKLWFVRFKHDNWRWRMKHWIILNASWHICTVTRCSVMRQQPSWEDYQQSQMDTALARNTLRLWTPVLSVLSFWFVLLPCPNFSLLRGDYYSTRMTCETETSLATMWISYCLMHMSDAFTALQTALHAKPWQTLLEWVLPFHFYFHPKQFYQRMQQIVRWIRYMRFAGPLIRILFKLNDQFLLFVRTRSQTWIVQVEKAKRLASRSMLFDDVQRIEPLAKMQRRLASVPSQMLHLAHEQAAGVGQLLSRKKEQGKKLRRKLERLKQMIRQSSYKKHRSSELYDRIVDLAQEIKTTIGDTVFTKHLISPQTRFSFGWRMIVTCALLTELCRLYVSYCNWELSNTMYMAPMWHEKDPYNLVFYMPWIWPVDMLWSIYLYWNDWDKIWLGMCRDNNKHSQVVVVLCVQHHVLVCALCRLWELWYQVIIIHAKTQFTSTIVCYGDNGTIRRRTRFYSWHLCKRLTLCVCSLSTCINYILEYVS